MILLYRHKSFTGKYTTCKIPMKLWDSSGIFSINSLVKISMISPISSLLILMIETSYETSSNVFSNLRKSLEIFGKLVARTITCISHGFPALTREILFLPFEHKIHIFSPPCNILESIYYVEAVPKGPNLLSLYCLF